jgi:hypothetical protein
MSRKNGMLCKRNIDGHPKMSFRFIFATVLLLVVQPIYAEDTYKFEPAVVELTGKLVEKIFYGPPGYGENPKTDSKEHAAILLLSKPIKVVAEKGDAFNETRDNAKEVQIINIKRIPLSIYFQKKVKVTGKLSSSITGHHHTDVLIEVDEIQLQK